MVGEISAFLLVTIKYDSTRSLRIKQSDGKYVRFSYAETSFDLHKKVNEFYKMSDNIIQYYF